MTTHGTARLRRSLDHQRGQGAMTYAMSMEDMENLVREVEDERDELPAEVTVVEVDTADEWEDGGDYVPRAVFTDHGRAEEYADALRSNGGRVWVVPGIVVNPATPDSWAAIERDARTIDEACTDLMSAADLVARCKKLAGVE